MKKLMTLFALCLVLTGQAQEKKDTTIEVKMSIQDFRLVLSVIDAQIDSKKISKELLEFLQKNASIVADKPKEIKK